MTTATDITDLRKLADDFEKNFYPSQDPARSISGLLRRAADRIEEADGRAEQAAKDKS